MKSIPRLPAPIPLAAWALCLACLLPTLPAPRLFAGAPVDPVVTNTDDAGSGSLRSALADATSESTITFDPGISGQTIRLTSGELEVWKDITIDASALDDGITVSGDATGDGPTPDDSRVFHITSGGHIVTLQSLTVTGGRSGDGVSGVLAGRGEDGGAIYNDGGTLRILDCSITDNRAGRGVDEEFGGGSGGSGGGIFQDSGTLLIRNSTLSGNFSGDGGDATTKSAGSGGNGGAIYNEAGMVIIQNTTIANNGTGDGGDDMGNIYDGFGGSGGGIYNNDIGTISLENSTVTGNTVGNTRDPAADKSGSGGGVFNNGSTTAVTNSILAENEIGTNGLSPDLFNGGASTVIRAGRNLVGDNSTVETEFPVGSPNANDDFVGNSLSPFDPELSPLGDHGGPTETLVPRIGSPVLDSGDNGSVPTEVDDMDQRGFDRVVNGTVDIGATERMLEQQPDLRIGKKKSEGTHKGDDLYTSSGSGQVQKVKPKDKKTEKVYTSIQNDGDYDSILLQSTPGKKKGLSFKTYRLTGGRTNVTASLKAAGYDLGDVRFGEVILFETKVKNKSGDTLKKTFKFTASSVGDPAKTDRGKPKVVAK